MLPRLVRRWVGHPFLKMGAENKRALLDLLEVNDKARVLDVGCGDGSFTTMIAAKVQSSHVFGMDILAQKLANELACKGINVVPADANRPFPFKDGTFDIVVANQLIEHLPDTDNFVKEAYRILRGGGHLHLLNAESS